ncbi:MAG TPA: Gfo/Idh/MocA family oxidoreductase, partial [Tepidisphaeraceae bacterium]|nr:Gfo/Idh/MocA family oxidoreductase [Tepidisphaeraceae bacterium]
MPRLDRRHFVQLSGLAAASLAANSFAEEAPPKSPPSERVRMGCIGVAGRAAALVHGFAAMKEVEVVRLCDIDSRRLSGAVEAVAKRTGKKPQADGDFRRIIDDNSIDAVAVGTPDHWHAISTILACLAGKDVYVEKPDGHNIVEGQRMVAAMRKHERIVQMGTQSRSSRHFLEAIEYLKSGKIGRCLVAKAWESGMQGSIGRPPDGTPPEGVDYDTWLGPAPKRPFNPARFHGNWRWFFDYGTGDLGNDGVHRLDVARWALSAAMEGAGEGPLPALPKTISAAGGKWYFDDAQEWPDTLQVDYQYDVPGMSGRVLTYEMRVWNPYPYHGAGEGAAVFGDKGYVILDNDGWRAFGNGGEKLFEKQGGIDDGLHFQNFIDCVKSRRKPAADLETIGHPSSVLCHAG